MTLRKTCETCSRKAVDNEFFAEAHWILRGHYPAGEHFEYTSAEERLVQYGKPRKKSLKEQIAEAEAEIEAIDREEDENELNSKENSTKNQ